MENRLILENLQQWLIQADLDCSIQEVEKPFSQPCLMIYGGNDSKNREQLIEITVQSIPLNPEVSSDAEEGEQYSRLQMDAPFPFAVQDLAMSEVAQFLHFLNLQIELPGFYLSYVDKIIVYRYILFCSQKNFPKEIILSILGSILFFQDIFGPPLEKLAEGQVTFVALLEEISEHFTKATTEKKD